MRLEIRKKHLYIFSAVVLILIGGFIVTATLIDPDVDSYHSLSEITPQENNFISVDENADGIIDKANNLEATGNILIMPQGGNVGVGRGSPSAKVDIVRIGSDTPGSSQMLRLGELFGFRLSNDYMNLYLDRYSNDVWRQPIMTFKRDTGDVLIGGPTGSIPNAKLHIRGGTSGAPGVAELLTFGTQNGAYMFGFRVDDDNLYLDRYSNGWQSTPAMIIDRTTGDLTVGGGIFAPSLTYDSGTGASLIYAGNEIRAQSSSKQYKKNINDLEIDTNKIYNLEPVSFTWKGDGTRDFGLIAEDVNKVLPELIVYDNEGNPSSVKYKQLSVLLLEELKKQQAQIEELKAENNELKQRIEVLEENYELSR